MAIDFGGLDITYSAGESLATHQYRFVHLENDTQVTMLDSGTEWAVGILQNAPASGEAAVVRVTGTSKLVMNQAVAVGDKIKTEYVGAADNGKGDKSVSSEDYIQGVCIMAAGAEDDVGGVLLVNTQWPLIASHSPSASVSPSASTSPSSSISPSTSRSPSTSISPSVSASASVSPSASISPSVSASRSASASVSPSASISPSSSASPST